MTVSTQTAKSQYTGNGVTVAFTGSFPILAATHVTVIVTTAGVDSTKVLNTDYTISGVGGSTFTVTFGAAPADGTRVTIARSVPLTQELDLTPNAALPSDQLEESYDKATMISQQINEAIARSVRFPVSDSTARVSELPTSTLRAGKVLAFDADGDVIVSTEDLDDIEGSITAAAASAAAAAASASAAQTAETNAETAETAAEAAQAAAEAAAASVPSFPIDPADTTFAATARVLGRKTAGAGTGEEVSLSELLDFIGSAAQGDILYRGAASWARLAAGTSGHFLKTNGAAANPAWAAAAGGFSTIGYAEYTTNADITAAIAYDDSIPQSSEGTQILSVTVNVPTTTAEVIVMAQGTTARTSGTSTGITALFNGGSNAIAANINYIDNLNAPSNWNIHHRYVPGSAGDVTFTVRTGPDTGTIRLNGTTSARFLGGVSKSTLLVFVREP